MAILGGLFSSKKDKRKADNGASIASSRASDVDTESIAGTEYDPHSPPQNNPNSVYLNPGASSSKLKLPFRRKTSRIGLQQPSASVSQLDPPHFNQFPSTRSEPAVDDFRLPPSRSALFGAYGSGEGSHSTRSLPNVTHNRSDSRDSSRTAIAPPPAPKKSGGLFAWARERTKSKPAPPPSQEEVDASFNLKSFRHVRTDSPSNSPENTDSFPIPPARPRGASIASDSSQRVSVAAFREMQARRSAANSPTPSASSRPTPIADNYRRTGSPNLRPPPHNHTMSASSSQSSLKQPSPRVPLPAPRKSMLRSSTSSESASEESNSDDEPLGTFPARSKAKSEAGHGSSPMVSPIRTTAPPLPFQTSNPNSAARPRASASTSAAAPNAAAKQAAAAAKTTLPKPARRQSNDSDSSESEYDPSSEDDAPLASLVAPRRPGSAMSTATTRTLPSKPLIDINSIKTPSSMPSSSVTSPALPAARSPQPQPQPPSLPSKDTLSPTNVNDRLAKVAQGISPKLSPASALPDRIVSGGRGLPPRSMTSPEVVVTNQSPSRVTEPPEHNKRMSITAADSFASSLSNGATSTTTTAQSASTSSSSSFEKVEYSPKLRMKRASLCLDDTSTPIIPKPIHHRAPPPGFSVMSRPSQAPNSPTKTTSEASSKVDSEGSSHHKQRDSFDFSSSVFSALEENRPSYDLSRPSARPTQSAPSSAVTSPSFPPIKPTTTNVRIINSTRAREPSPSKVLPTSTASTPPGRKRSSTIISNTSSQPVVMKKPSPASALKKPSSPSPNTSMSPSTSASTSKSTTSSSSSSALGHRQQKSVPLISMIPDSPTGTMPPKPFASNSQMRGNSPASSTGDSSSGRGAPVTPRDGSEIGSELGIRGRGRTPMGTGSSSGVSTLNARKAAHRKSTSYDDKTMTSVNIAADEETRRRERRRSEAKNAIELGNVMNKPIRLNDEDEDNMAPPGMAGVDPRMSMFNPMINGMGMGMGMGMSPPNMQMNMNGGSPQMSPWLPPMNPQGQNPMMQQYMMPQPPANVDPHFFAAHQQAMMVAKQAYQYAVAQQAMAAAADEWERGSSVSMMTGGAPGWGGSTAGSMMFPTGARSMYAGSAYGGSEIGGPTAGWGSSSVYGGSYGPTADRSSMISRNGGFPGMPPRTESAQVPMPVRPGARPRTKTAPPENGSNGRSNGAPFAAVAQEQARARGRTPPPPSSWKR